MTNKGSHASVSCLALGQSYHPLVQTIPSIAVLLTHYIASREEILNIPKVKLYSPDLSYLEKAPQTSLAGRLARPKFQPKDVPEQLAREQKTIDVAALTQKRIEKRLAREG